MATYNETYQKIPRLLGLLVMTLFIMSISIQPQITSEQRIELTDIAILNILNGIQSDNYGVKLNCIYFAGRYKIIDVSKELVDVLKSSDDDELCQMLIWSLYQIGDESCCEKLQQAIENHPSKELSDFCKNLRRIHEYGSAIANN